MLALMRQSRFLALALVLLAPGIAGSAVQWLHACPVEAPSAVTQHQHDDSSSSDAGHATCQCIGACNSAGIASLTRPVTVRVADIQPERRVTLPSGSSLVPLGTPSDLLPPATAPPLS
jgi:hypothetical protein